MTNAKLYKLTKGKVKEYNKKYDHLNKVCIPHADTEYIITSHNTYHITNTYVFYR